MTDQITRRQMLATTGSTLAGLALAGNSLAREAGERPQRAEGIEVINPRGRVPVGLIIDDSTCLVNLNRFAMPQFNRASRGANKKYHRNWRSWPLEIPDAFVRKFGEWCGEEGVKGKYSVVPYPACVGRLDREVPGWSRQDINNSIKLVRDLMMPNWDIHPEMVTHTRVIDLKTGHPYADDSVAYMENWDWSKGRSTDELTAYHVYALQILKNVGLDCEGLTTPGGYGNKVLPELAQSSLQSVKEVFSAEIPHYFRHLYTDNRSVAPQVQYASGLNTQDPQCVVSVIGCTGDWTGGWDNVEPVGADRFVSADLSSGRMVDVITRNEPAMMVCHWTGIHWNGEEKGFRVFQEVVRRLKARFDNLIWMKTSELSRYWAAKELTRIEVAGDKITLTAPFACPGFTLNVGKGNGVPVLRTGNQQIQLNRVSNRLNLQPGTWATDADTSQLVCFDLPKGTTHLNLQRARL